MFHYLLSLLNNHSSNLQPKLRLLQTVPLLHLLQQSKTSSFFLCNYRFISHSFNKYYSEFVFANFNSLISVLFLLGMIFPSIIYYSYVCACILSNAMIYGFRHEVERWRERGVDDKKGISCGFGIYFNSTNIHTVGILISQVHHSCLRELGHGNFKKALCFSQFLTLNTKFTTHFI